MSTSASASKIPNKKILKKSRKSDLLEDRLLLPVEQDVVLPFDTQTVQLDSERSVPAEPITELSSSSETNLGAPSNSTSGSELGNSGSLLLAQNGSKEDFGQLVTPFKSSLWTDLAEILNADTSSSSSGSAGLWGNELWELGDSSKDILLAQNTSKEDTSTSSAGSGSTGVDVSTSTMAMVLGGLALLGAAAGGGGGGSSSSTTSTSSSSTTPVSAATSSSGSLADGYIANALVFRDVNNNSVWDKESFTDANNNGIYDTGETFVDANADGLFTVACLHTLKPQRMKKKYCSNA